jgi:hypothetical protein
MERESAAPEDLPPLELRKLRDLEVEEPSGPGRPLARGGAARDHLEPVYSLLREHVAELNVEGAATMGDRLWLLQRGSQ